MTMEYTGIAAGGFVGSDRPQSIMTQLARARDDFQRVQNLAFPLTGYKSSSASDEAMSVPRYEMNKSHILKPSCGASVVTLLGVLAIAIGLAGQWVVGGSGLFGMISGLGFAAVATVVLAHQR